MMYFQVIAGFVLLLGGAEFLVRGAVALSNRLGVSPLVIGMTVVAFGTSAPELVVSLNAALSGSAGLALGNVVGSNIANILLVLGATGLVAPIIISPGALIRDGMALLGGSLLFTGLCWRGEIVGWGGGVLLIFFAAFLGYSYWRETHGADDAAEIHLKEAEEYQDLPDSLWIAWGALLAGLAGVIYGADLLVEGGTAIARAAGVSEEVIGLTLIAFGTSLPELAASVVAAFRKHTDLALGNVVGSNLFNVLGVIGTVAVVTPLQVPTQILTFDLWVMIGATVLLIPFLATGLRLSRTEAVIFLAGYVAYIAAQAYGVQNVLGAIG